MREYTAPRGTCFEIFSDVNEETNILIGGSQGSGKSVFEDGMLYNLANEFTPDDVEIHLIDPKMVQLRKWAVLPHVKSYADTTRKAKFTMDIVKNEMMSRYEAMSRAGLEKWYGMETYLFIDELADIILEDKTIVKDLQKLLQLCRAAGIHIVACSQSVSRITVPAVLQINFSCRVGLRTADAIDSRQIIQAKGCESLPRFGRCLLKTPDGLEERPVPMYTKAHIDAMRSYWMKEKARCSGCRF